MEHNNNKISFLQSRGDVLTDSGAKRVWGIGKVYSDLISTPGNIRTHVQSRIADDPLTSSVEAVKTVEI